MFFADATGYLALLSLIVQCVLAWVFAVFLGAMRPGRATWLHSLFAAFVGMGIGLTALCVRFVLAHHWSAGDARIEEGTLACRLLYGTYLGGKALFLWGLVRGVAMWRRQCQLRAPAWMPVAFVVGSFAAGAALGSVGALLMVHAPFVVVAGVYATVQLRQGADESRELGRATVRGAVAAMAAAWLVYWLAIVFDGPNAYVLRINSLIDLVLEVVLAVGIIVAVMSAAEGTLVLAYAERDRLRERVQRDDKLRAMATLASGVAHEINNPLTAILGYSADLASEDPEQRAAAARIVREQADRCRAIVRRMSLLGSKRALVPSRFEVAPTLQRVVDGLRHKIALTDARLECVVHPPDLRLTADVTGFEQVVANLVANAIQVTPPGGRVRVRVDARADGALLTVADQGPGVPLADRARVFEPFFTTRFEQHGTGLGLAVADAIVREHGGSIDVDDGELGGARFRALWPWRMPERAAAGESAAAVAGAEAIGLQLPPSTGRLLVIDDEPAVRSTIARHALALGWNVVARDSASQALDYLFARRGECDAIVCDVRMPGVSGAQFHDEVARRAPALLRRTLFLTGDRSAPEVADFAARCRTAIVTKPFDTADLFVRLGSLANPN